MEPKDTIKSQKVKDELLNLLNDKNASLYARLAALVKLYPEYEEFNLILNIDNRTILGTTALMKACAAQNLELVKFFLEAGSDINAKDNAGWTALTIACLRGNKEIAKFLLESGADINVKTSDGDSLIDLASVYGYTELVELLKQYEAKKSN